MIFFSIGAYSASKPSSLRVLSDASEHVHVALGEARVRPVDLAPEVIKLSGQDRDDDAGTQNADEGGDHLELSVKMIKLLYMQHLAPFVTMFCPVHTGAACLFKLVINGVRSNDALKGREYAFLIGGCYHSPLWKKRRQLSSLIARGREVEGMGFRGVFSGAHSRSLSHMQRKAQKRDIVASILFPTLVSTPASSPGSPRPTSHAFDTDASIATYATLQVITNPFESIGNLVKQRAHAMLDTVSPPLTANTLPYNTFEHIMDVPDFPFEDLNVNIPTFHMLCSRLSNLENDLETVIRNAKHNQMTAFGHLDHKLLGYPFTIERRPSCQRKAPDGAKADHYPWDALITITLDENCCKGHDTVGFCDGNVSDRAFFAPEELRLLDDKDLSSHPPPKSLGIKSSKTCLCRTAIQRQLDQGLNSGPFTTPDFGKCTFLWSYEDSWSMFLRGGPDQDVSEFVAEALRLFLLRGHKRSCVRRMDIEDGDIMFLRIHQYGMEWLVSTEADREKIELFAKFAFVQYLDGMRKHARFASFLPSYIGMFDATATLVTTLGPCIPTFSPIWGLVTVFMRTSRSSNTSALLKCLDDIIINTGFEMLHHGALKKCDRAFRRKHQYVTPGTTNSQMRFLRKGPASHGDMNFGPTPVSSSRFAPATVAVQDIRLVVSQAGAASMAGISGSVQRDLATKIIQHNHLWLCREQLNTGKLGSTRLRRRQAASDSHTEAGIIRQRGPLTIFCKKSTTLDAPAFDSKFQKAIQPTTFTRALRFATAASPAGRSKSEKGDQAFRSHTSFVRVLEASSYAALLSSAIGRSLAYPYRVVH
ncbi:hypothetical protein BDZ88DRAFT_442561 [Geranomyces variabilis]|nr:hypothetical protein BDZ88DRAFT_442561 [Geranomyces variabilis]